MRIWLEPNDDPRKKLKFGWRLVGACRVGTWRGSTPACPTASWARRWPRADRRSSAATAPSGPSNAMAKTAASISYLIRAGAARRLCGGQERPSAPGRRLGGVSRLRHRAGREASGGTWPHRARRGAGGDALCRAAHRLRTLPPRPRPRSRLRGAFDAAREAGVEMMCHGTEISPDGVSLDAALPVDPARQAGRFGRHGRLTGNRHAKTLAWQSRTTTGD
jgi:sugar fermentation stimulation protein A